MNRYIVTVLMCAALAGCSTNTQPQPHEASPTVVETHTATPVGSSTPTDATSPISEEDSEGQPDAIQADTATVESAQRGVSTMMAIWVQGKTLPQQQWEHQLRDTLAPESVDISLKFWGHKVPDTTVVSIQPVRVDSSSGTFLVTTDQSTYYVTALRQVDNRWLVSDIRPQDS